jgi:hypothetical protein
MSTPGKTASRIMTTAGLIASIVRITGKSHRPFAGLGESSQVAPQTIEVAVLQERLNFQVGMLPDWHRIGEQSPALSRQTQPSTTPVSRIWADLDQAAALQRLECGGQGGAIHGQQRGHRPHARRLRTIQRHQQRELAVRQPHRAQCVVETPCQRPCRPLHVQTEATIANQQRSFKRNDGDS